MRKIAHFPIPYPDELFYGTISRHQFIHDMTYSEVMKELFDLDAYKVNIDYPVNLETFCSRINNIITAEEIIDNHTLMGIYLPFCEKRYQEEFIQAVKSSNPKDGSLLRTRSKTSDLQYCPLCVDEDLSVYGETYLHRMHQIPGVIACAKHGVRLEKYPDLVDSAKYFRRISRRRTNTKAIQSNEFHVDLARKAFNVLNGAISDANLEDTRVRYKQLLIKAGFTRGKNITRKAFANEFIKYFDVDLLSEYFPSLLRTKDIDVLSYQIHRMFFINQLSVIDHLLVLSFFNISLKDFNAIPIDASLAQKRSKIPKTIIVETEDEKILKKLKTFYQEKGKHYRYGPLTMRTMFSNISIRDWEEKIKEWPESLKYLKTICHSYETGIYNLSCDLIDDHHKMNLHVPLTVEMVQKRFKKQSERQLDAFELLRDRVEDYIKESYKVHQKLRKGPSE